MFVGRVTSYGHKSDMPKIKLTREHLLKDDDQDWAERFRGHEDVMTPRERADALRAAQQAVPDRDNVWVFGYGSLIWNPALDYTESAVARVYGYRRAFCLRSHIGRGTRECPGLMLGLDRGGSCVGLALKLPAPSVNQELDLLFKREMLTRIYHPTWVKAHIGGEVCHAITFVVDRSNARYVSGLHPQQGARMIREAKGRLGPCHEYLLDTERALKKLGIRDRTVEDMARRVREELEAQR